MIDFFNAIEKHQAELKRKLEDAGPTEFRKSKVIKGLKEDEVTAKLEAETVSLSLFKSDVPLDEAEYIYLYIYMR